jgi:S-formylglutathione hydrolase FrmB
LRITRVTARSHSAMLRRDDERVDMKIKGGLSALLRILCVAALPIGFLGITVSAGISGKARAAGYESLFVPSAAMGRDIPVAFLAGGPHAVYLLDPFDAGPDVSNWVTAGNAMSTLAGKGISVVAPAGGAYSMYTNWEQDGSKQWDTFLSTELPNWLAANKGLAPGGHAVVGASQGAYAAMAQAAFHPDRFTFAASLSGFLYPSYTTYNGAILAGMQQFGGVDANGMWGAPQFLRWRWHDPYVHATLLASNNTRLWVYSPNGQDASDPAAMIGQAAIAMGSTRDFYQQYRSVGGRNAHIDLPAGGDNGWGPWSGQLQAMSGDLATTIR